MSVQRKEEDADMHLAQKIVQNKKFSISGQADDEYDFDDGPRRKSRKKVDNSDRNLAEKNSFTKRILTQQERCQFCFENPKMPKHLIVSIANFTYLMLPQWQPVVPGHCCILPMQVSHPSPISQLIPSALSLNAKLYRLVELYLHHQTLPSING